MVAPVFLAFILSIANDHKVHLPALFRGLEIDATDFELPGVAVSRGDVMTVIRRALKLLPRPLHGIHVGKRAMVTEYGALALGLLASATLGEAISLATRFPQSSGHLLQLHEEATSDGRQQIALPYPGDWELQDFLVDLTFSAWVQLRRQITAGRYTPAKVEFVCEAPPDVSVYEAYFGCPVHFHSQRNALTTHLKWLDFRLPWANVKACRLSVQLLETEAGRFNSMPALGFSVERAIRRHLPNVPEFAQVAESLNLSERTLRRQLAQLGLNFRQLLDDSRKAQTFALMTSGNREISEIAAAAGFSDPRAFTRAFKRWTGRPPSQFKTMEANISPFAI
jgi:AraC-like DNA-binding protein